MPRGDVMLGPRGRVMRPRSESAELNKAYALLENMRHHALPGEDRYRLQRAMEIIKGLSIQVSEGYHANPYTPFKLVGVIGKDVHSVAYQHAKDGKLYKHDFQRGSAQAIAVERHGKRDILITGDVPLWDEF